MFFLALHLHNTLCFYLTPFIHIYSLSLCVWIETESKMRPPRKPCVCFKGIVGANAGVASTSLWRRWQTEHHKGYWGAIGYRISIRNLVSTFLCTLHLKSDSRRKQGNQCFLSSTDEPDVLPMITFMLHSCLSWKAGRLGSRSKRLPWGSYAARSLQAPPYAWWLFQWVNLKLCV